MLFSPVYQFEEINLKFDSFTNLVNNLFKLLLHAKLIILFPVFEYINVEADPCKAL